MADDEYAKQLAALERELAETRRAAMTMILGMAEAIVRSPEGREELAASFEEAAAEMDTEVAAKMARQVAAAIRRG